MTHRTINSPSRLLTESPSHLSPLPQRCLTGDEGTGGRIKQRPEDFLVDEQPLYQPSGEGEHLYLCIEKRNVSHVELMSALRKHFGVRERSIGFAGMKDKVGITRQIVSIHRPQARDADPPDLNVPHERIAILWAERHGNKLKRGHLAGNRFSIRIREVDPIMAPRALRVLRKLEHIGVPNYFGMQRFGYRRNNHLLGAMLLAGEHQALLDELLGTKGTPFPEYQRERRELFEQRRYADALEMWTPADGSERSALRALSTGRNAKAACFAAGKTTWNFWIASLQSANFNRVLDQRLEEGALDALRQGDLAWKHDSRAVFAVSAELARDADIARRLAEFEISPSGPLWGRRMTRTAGQVNDVEEAALGAMGFTPGALVEAPHCPQGGRRPLREPLRNADLESGLDEHGPYIRVAFDLPRGVYATIALREIMKTDEAE